MNIIFVSKHIGRSKTLRTGAWQVGLSLFLLLLVLPLAVGYGGYKVAEYDDDFSDDTAVAMRQAVENQQKEVERVIVDSKQQIRALSLKMANLQAQLVRINALGERVATLSKLDIDEFDFSTTPAMGGPEEPSSSEESEFGNTAQLPSLVASLDNLTLEIQDRMQKLEILESILARKSLENQTFLSGRPILKGWKSSAFGLRKDPFTGRVAMHYGMDFAGKLGSPVVTVGGGIVMFSGYKRGYGKLVEINHTNGYTTRYGHHQKLLVKRGDIVKKGQVIGTMGSSGRSTGPHVHFEVLKGNRQIDPSSFIRRKAGFRAESK